MDLTPLSADKVVTITLNVNGGTTVIVGPNNETISVGLPPAAVNSIVIQVLALAQVQGTVIHA